MKCSFAVLLFIMGSFLVSNSDCYRILFLAPFPVPSHWLWLDHFVREMLNRGHHVTALTNFATKAPHPNYTELIIDPPYNLEPDSPAEWIFQGKYYSYKENLFLLWRVGLPTTRHAFESSAGQKLLHDPQYKFDLVISEQFHQEAMLLFGHKFNAPIVTISTYDLTEYLDESKGFRPSLGVIPHIILPFTESMSFTERCYNIFISYLDKIVRNIYYLPINNGMARHFFNGDAKNKILPTIQEMESQVAVTLFNSHPAMTLARPRMPSHFQVGGVHLKPSTKELPEPIKTFLDGADQGAVYFSFGSHVMGSKLSRSVINSFLVNFKKLPHRVLWKYEKDDILPDLPENVMTVKWVPQTDVLAHENVILFINHGGVFGTQESTYHGVPMLTIPFYGDQFRNAKNAERNGHALVLNYHDITEETVKDKLNELLFNEEYRNKATEVASLFRDNLVDPMDVAMYWIEFVARHKGAPHLQSKAVDLPFWVYYNLDIYLSVVVAFFTFTSIAFVSLNKLIGKKKKSKDDKKKLKRN